MDNLLIKCSKGDVWMKKLNVFITVGAYCNNISDPLFTLVRDRKIEGLRFNLGKYSNVKDIYEKALFIKAVKMKYRDIQIMLDIPFPGHKQRIKISGNKLAVKKGKIAVFSCKGYPCIDNIIVESKCFFEKIKKDQILIYADGDCAFKVVETNKEQMEAYALVLNDAVLYSGKSITTGDILCDEEIPMYLSDVISIVNPNFVALSFVSDCSDIKKIRKVVDSNEVGIVSKVESRQAINNLEGISKNSDIMMARGDLLLNVPLPIFPEIQKRIADITNANSKRLFCATGILNSLIQMDTIFPSQADLNDLYILLNYRPYALILNYRENRIEAFHRILEIITQMEQVIASNVRDGRN